MKALPALALAALAAAPLAAEPTPEQAEVTAAADAFFAALRSDDKLALGRHMDSAGTIFVHDRMNPAAPRIVVISVPDHLARWAKGTRKVDEVMRYDHVMVDGDMAQIWGPYRFMSEGQTSHCGINAMSMVRTDEGRWVIGNTSFTMVPPAGCAALGAPEVPGQ